MQSARAPTFWTYVKKNVQSNNISDICDENGNKIMSQSELKTYVTNFYQSLYRFDDTVQGEIDDFLGLDILTTQPPPGPW